MTDPLLSVRDLTVRFKIRGATPFRDAVHLTAVDGVTFDVARGEALAIVGESGSGKSTTALAIARLIEHHSGEVRLDGQDLLTLKGAELRKARRKFQFIFQDPYSSLNPRRRASAIVTEPLASIGIVPKGERKGVVDDLFEAVGLRPEQQNLFPHQFSGGQRQRIGIARALAPNPELVICDEAVSALDVAVQAQILNLLRRLQRERGLTYLFISHDLGVVQHMCDRIAVMYMGKIVEFADRLSLFNGPLHPYTIALLSAVPNVDAARRAHTRRVLLTGEPPNPLDPPPGCRFASRCPVAEARCRTEPPPLREVRAGHCVACHLVGDDGRAPILAAGPGGATQARRDAT